MADYYPLIARAVGGLDKNTGEIRRALYERARSALVNPLRSVDPALNESDVTRERLALEEAIRKVEAEAAKRSSSDTADEDEDHTYARPARSYGRLIKIVLLLLIVAGVAGAAYWQRSTLTSLVASFRTDSEMNMWDLAIPIFAYGVIAFIFAYVFFKAVVRKSS